MKNIFQLDSLDKSTARLLNPQTLAFVGDAVFSLYVRNFIVLENSNKITELHSLTTKYVKASGQSLFVDKLKNILSQEEQEIFRRARNYKTNNIAKNSSVSDYKKATGFEAVLGYLYLTNDFSRLNELMMLCKGEYNEN